MSKPAGEGMVRVTFLPEGKTVEFEFDTLPYEGHGEPMSFLDVAENYGIFLDHACGGVCACTTCHVPCEGRRVGGLVEAEDKELDRMETAADVQLNSRLGCQAVIEKPGDVCGGDSEVESELCAGRKAGAWAGRLGLSFC